MKAKKLLTMMNRVIPKKNIILFDSYPDYSDNARSLYEYIVANRPDITCNYTIIWAANNYKRTKSKINSGIKVIKKKSIRGLTYFLQAKYIFTTHGYFSNVYSGFGQKQINLWHGCGYKKMPDEDRMYRGDVTIVPGETYKTVQAREFDIEEKNVLVTGLPRNDELFKKNEFELLKIGVDKSDYKSILIWMPTYRKANVGHNTTDGNVECFGISTITAIEYDKLNKVLKDKRILLLIKPHPMDSITIDISKTCSNIKLISNRMLLENNISLYGLLGQTDGLLSDYSSVVIDYLLMNKPIVMTISDMEEYRNSRGFLFDDLENYLPGPIIGNLNELIEYFTNMEEVESRYISKRLRLINYFHDFLDEKSSERVTKAVFG